MEKHKIALSANNIENVRATIRHYKNSAICGVEGVGKITHTLNALIDDPTTYYLGNPVDYVGKLRTEGYEKYIEYIRSLKQDLHIIENAEEDFSSTLADGAVLIIDEIYGRSKRELHHISKALDRPDVRVVQIVGCLKNLGDLVCKFDIVLEFTSEGAVLFDKKIAEVICKYLKKED